MASELGPIRALIERLPEEGPWPAAERVNWPKMLAMAMSCGQEPDIEIKEAAN